MRGRREAEEIAKENKQTNQQGIQPEKRENGIVARYTLKWEIPTTIGIRV